MNLQGLNFNFAENIAKTIQNLLKLRQFPQDRRGVIFGSAHALLPDTLLVQLLVGDLPAERAIRFTGFMKEKLNRSSQHKDHTSGYQSADFSDDPTRDHKMYPGAITTPSGIILSCSGAPWQCDELINAIAGVNAKLMDEAHAYEVAKISKNEWFDLYLNKFGW